ncbi:MAG: Hsp70 family protein [Corynebacteriales bacterium]|nr:Hsp70 family protein [Mycobacteriales bacterium]
MTALGIDLGTTYSAMAIVEDAQQSHARIVPNTAGETTTPSAVYFDAERPIVGTQARLAATVAPADCIELVKRHMGDASWRFETSAGTSYSAAQISALILRRLALDAEAALNESIRQAVITVPAYFDDARRRATAQAGVIAGLDVLRVLNEPTAAALAFGYRTAPGPEQTVLVYDLGGGTFDVTVVRIDGDDFRVLATAGDRNLGGFDFDNVLMLHVDEQLQKLGDESSLDGEHAEAVLRDRCEQAKRALSTLPEVSVKIGEHGIPISRGLFTELSAPLLRSTEEITQEVLGEADIEAGYLDSVLLVGGSTRMPMVAAMLERITGTRVDRSVHPDEAVALGAAICADQIVAGHLPQRRRRPTIFDVTAHSLGVVARSGNTGAEINTVVIARNTPIPAQGRRRFHTLAENQREILVVVTEGEDEDPAYVTIVGSARIRVPPHGHDEMVVEVILGYTADGMIEVSVLDAQRQRELGEFVIDRQAAIDKDELDKMRAALHTLDI